MNNQSVENLTGRIIELEHAMRAMFRILETYVTFYELSRESEEYKKNCIENEETY